MIKIAVIGDRHLSRRSPRYAHARAIWSRATADAKEQGATHFVNLGDSVEGDPDGDERVDLISLYSEQLDVATERGGSVWEGLGNHESLAAIRWLSALGVIPVWDRIAWTPVYALGLPAPAAVMVLCPYPRRGWPPFEGVHGTIRASIDAATASIQAVIARARELATADGVPLLFFGHLGAAGMRTRDTVFETHNATEVILPLEVLEPCDLAVLSHIHEAQDLTDKIRGCGSIVRDDFAEAGDEKSYSLVTVEGQRVTFERRPLGARRMIELEVTWDARSAGKVVEEAVRRLERLPHEVEAHEWPEMKLVVHVPADARTTFDPSAFEVLRERCSHLVVDPRTEHQQRVRAPGISREAGLEGQFRMWLDSTGQAVPPERWARLREKIARVPA